MHESLRFVARFSKFKLGLRCRGDAASGVVRQPMLLAELYLAHPAGFVLRHQLLGLRSTPAASLEHNLLLVVHPSLQPQSLKSKKMVCSDAHSRTVE